MYVLGVCEGLEPNYYLVGQIDPTSGKVVASDPLSASALRLPVDPGDSDGSLYGDIGFLSTSPLVAVFRSTSGNDVFYGAFVGLTSSLQVSWSNVQRESEPGGLDFGDNQDSTVFGRGMHVYTRAVVAGSTLYAVTTFYATDQNGAAEFFDNKLVAFDTGTGKQRWATQVPKVGLAVVAGVQGNTVFAVGQSVGGANDEQTPDLVLARLDARSGALLGAVHQRIPVPNSNMTLPAEADLDSSEFVVADGRAYGATTRKPLPIGMAYPQVFSVG